MSVKVYGCNHIAIEVDDIEKGVAFYQDAFFKLGEHQFLAMFELGSVQRGVVRQTAVPLRLRGSVRKSRAGGGFAR